MDAHKDLTTIFQRKTIFANRTVNSLVLKSFKKWGLLFPLRVAPSEKGCKHFYIRVVSLESVSIPFSRLIAKSAISLQMSNAFIIFSWLQIKGY